MSSEVQGRIVKTRNYGAIANRLPVCSYPFNPTYVIRDRAATRETHRWFHIGAYIRQKRLNTGRGKHGQLTGVIEAVNRLITYSSGQNGYQAFEILSVSLE